MYLIWFAVEGRRLYHYTTCTFWHKHAETGNHIQRNKSVNIQCWVWSAFLGLAAISGLFATFITKMYITMTPILIADLWKAMELWAVWELCNWGSTFLTQWAYVYPDDFQRQSEGNQQENVSPGEYVWNAQLTRMHPYPCSKFRTQKYSHQTTYKFTPPKNLAMAFHSTDMDVKCLKRALDKVKCYHWFWCWL